VSEEITQNMNGNRSFEERVFARFDGLDFTLKDLDLRLKDVEVRLKDVDGRLKDVDGRLKKLEAKSYDTKPIWERALTEILSVSQKVDTVERKLNVLGQDMLTLRADQNRLEERMDKN
jgi:chromosome segregation ATPase